MLVSGHGESSGGTARFSEVRGAAVVGGSAVAPGSASSRSGPAGGCTPAVSQPLGRATEERGATGAEAGRTRRTKTAVTPGRLTAPRARTEGRSGGPRP